jgi:hypothetical protein
MPDLEHLRYLKKHLVSFGVLVLIWNLRYHERTFRGCIRSNLFLCSLFGSYQCWGKKTESHGWEEAALEAVG